MFESVKIRHDLWIETDNPCIDLVIENSQNELVPNVVLNEEEISDIIIETVEEIERADISKDEKFNDNNNLSEDDKDPFGSSTRKLVMGI